MKLDTTPSRMFQFDSTVNNITVTTGQANAASPPGPVDFENMGWNYNNVPSPGTGWVVAVLPAVLLLRL